MPPLVPSYIDKELAEAINGKVVPKHGIAVAGEHCAARDQLSAL